MSKVVILKLTTGEEVIAKEEWNMKSSTVGEVRSFFKPRVFHMMRTPEGIQGSFIPWLLTAPDADVEILDSFIVTKIDAPTDIEKAYLKNTSSIELLS